jgi:hypothetical protein
MRTISLRTKVQFEELKQYPNNHDFNCYLWDDIPDKSAKDVVIMFHGFLEGVSKEKRKRDKFLFRYKLIAEELNKNGIVAILLPLPFHFDRSVGVSQSDEAAPLTRLRIHGSFLYFGGFTQVILDFDALYNLLKESPDEFSLVENFQINILGYSIGGISAITIANYLKNNLSVEVNSLMLMLSAWKIDDIIPSSIGEFFSNSEPNFNEELWRTMMSDLSLYRDDKTMDPLFKHLIWGTGEEVNFEELANRVLFIEGQFDEIFRNELVQERKQSIQNRNFKNCTFISIPSNHVALQPSIAKSLSKYISLYMNLS